MFKLKNFKFILRIIWPIPMQKISKNKHFWYFHSWFTLYVFWMAKDRLKKNGIKLGRPKMFTLLIYAKIIWLDFFSFCYQHICDNRKILHIYRTIILHNTIYVWRGRISLSFFYLPVFHRLLSNQKVQFKFYFMESDWERKLNTKIYFNEIRGEAK